MHTIPSEVCTQIVHCTNECADLLALTCTSKEFQYAAEKKLYTSLAPRNAQNTYLLCQAVVARDHRGASVRRFILWLPTRQELPLRLWQAIQDALVTMINLEVLMLDDANFSNTWVLNSPEITFQLLDANFYMPWDANMVAFLETQDRLQTLHVDEVLEDGPICPLSAGKLQTLHMFSGPLVAILELLASPLTHVQLTVDAEAAPIVPNILAEMDRIKPLRSIAFVKLPEAHTLEVLQRHEVHRHLVQMRALDTIDLDCTRWAPTPHDVFQRMLAAELRTFCPNLRRVGFWFASLHCVWTCIDEDWGHPTNSQAQSAPPTPSITALPSLAHSLSSFPSMTSVTNDMVHYGMSCHTKSFSETKLHQALQKTKQRQSPSPSPTTPSRDLSDDDDEPGLFMLPKKHRVCC
ncbi:hypothetical protein WOLCODRAFT_88698 [Wolfiporia cocos MD-104 SS10]|uniref:F-box domain-containing protein n=1 Tax=Wolfiporia cocos (strain MD-104) TaxID=742152 RepID=A0A2H3JFY9_WOLCO|nr:hypothetical protein WOLCODRAFT_88698 [Wolfiporia cocos MD-104 SS10]